MQKLKKALKKLVKPSSPSGVKRTEAKAAKGAMSAKKKPEPMAAKKAASSTGMAKKKASAAKPAPVKGSGKPAPKVSKPATKTAGAKVGASKASLAKVVKKVPAPPAKAVAAKGKDEKPKKLLAKAPVPTPEKSKVAVPGAKDRKGDRATEPAPTKSLEKASELEGRAAPESEDDEVFLTDAEGRRYCRVKECDQLATVDAYCRYHYLLFWKKIQVRKKILTEGKLDRYIEDLTARYPDKYLEMLRKDLRNEKDFTAAIQELEIDESGVDNEYEDEAQSYLEEVRGMGSETSTERTDDEY